jgi:hypothetical protein
MSAQIRPNRLDVNDRFPMLGFTIRTDGTPARAEVAVATDPEVFRADRKAQRSESNFYSSRARGPLAVPRGEAVYVLPAEVLARFVGQERLYFGLAITPETTGAKTEVAAMPTSGSPYVSIKNLTGRSLRRVRLTPSRQQRAAGYGANGGGLEWAGDAVTPGLQAADGSAGRASAAKPGGATPPSERKTDAADYDDGFGPLPAPSAEPSPTPAAATPEVNPAPSAQALGWPDLVIEKDVRSVNAPTVSILSGVKETVVRGLLLAASGPTAPLVIALQEAAKLGGVSIGLGPAVSGGLWKGGELGVGVIFGPAGELGVYGSAGLMEGVLASISLTAQITVVDGGIDRFGGWSRAVGFSVGEEPVIGGSLLLDMSNKPMGISFEAGIGKNLFPGLPGELYAAVKRGWSTQLGVEMEPAAPRALADESFTVNWDAVELIPQPTGLSCWAAAAAMVVGWKDQVCLSPDSVAKIAGRLTNAGLPYADTELFATEIGLDYEQPKNYIPDGLRDLLETRGPLWVGKIADATNPASGGHAVVVTGMYGEGPDIFVRITDPWDREVGTPGAPGKYRNTHQTGSRYIMRWESFCRDYEAVVIDGVVQLHAQVLHSGGTGGRKPSYGGNPPGYAMARVQSVRARASLTPPPPPVARGLEGDATTEIGGRGNVTWRTERYPGIKRPSTPVSGTGKFTDQLTRVADWPRVAGLENEIYADFRVLWQFDGASLGNVRFENDGARDGAGWSLHVNAKVQEVADAVEPAPCAALTALFQYRFTGPDGGTLDAEVAVTLFGDGTTRRTSRWIAPTPRTGDSPVSDGPGLKSRAV